MKSFRFAFNGICNLIKKEHNARIHFVALMGAIGFGILFKISLNEWIAITIVSGLVILTELINTAIEQLADFVEPERNEKIGLIKDYCAGAVLISAIIALIVGALIFTPKLTEIVKTIHP
ncbi:MAG: diacylglycerol kinase family protein [Chitinophagales bacterium]